MDIFKGFSRKVSGKRSKLRRICSETGKVEKLKKLQHLNPKYDVAKERFVSISLCNCCLVVSFLLLLSLTMMRPPTSSKTTGRINTFTVMRSKRLS